MNPAGALLLLLFCETVAGLALLLAISILVNEVLHEGLMSNLKHDAEKAWQAELDRMIREDIEDTNAALGIKARPVASYKDRKNLPEGSLQHLAKKLGISQRQARRICEKGFVPGAFRTPGGHWRVPSTQNLLNKVNAARKGKIRRRGWLDHKKRSRKLAQCQLPPEPEELLHGIKAYEMGPNRYNLLLAIRILHAAEKPVTVTGLAEEMGCSRSTLYRRYGKKYLINAITAYTVDTHLVSKDDDHFQDLGKNYR
ncbi:MAG TPA: hypothetical protein VEC99_17415 [Clostridia bacterium]|nr:hypothetical protein [Clostridia bacterium]